MDRISYLDFDLKITGSGEQFTAVVLRSPGGEGQVSFTLPFSTIELENLMLRMTRLRASRRKDSPEMEAARSLGGGLFQAVFQGAVGKCLSKSQEKITEQTGLRIKLRLQEAPDLSELPWEFLFDKDEGRFLAQSTYTPIVRYLEFGGSISPLKVTLPLHILGVVANPSDYRPPLNVKDEQQRLKSALGELIKGNLVKITWLEQATLDSLRRALRTGTYHVFHFIGHGGFDRRTEQGVLVFTDEYGRSQEIGAERLGVLLHDHRSLRLAVLNACEGARSTTNDPFAGVASNLVRQGIPAVVAMQFEISDTSARAFAGEFYAALAQGYPVDAAQAEARKAIYCLPEDVEWGTPVLYLRSSDGVLFDVAEPPIKVEKAPEPKLAEPVEAPVKKATPKGPRETRKPPAEPPAKSQMPAIPQEQLEVLNESGQVLPSDLYTFVYLPKSKVWISKYPVTNIQYQRFLEAPDFAEKDFWIDFPKYGGPLDYPLQGDWGKEGWDWLQTCLKNKKLSPDGVHVEPRSWRDPDYGVQRPGVPVVAITWYEANAYCKWLCMHWSKCEEVWQHPQLSPIMVRLPLESEWEEAAGGIDPPGRYAWDQPGKVTTDVNEIITRANVYESNIRRTTPVNRYPLGVSPLGVWDLTGNVNEWQANIWGHGELSGVVRGGGWNDIRYGAHCTYRDGYVQNFLNFNLGFRVICSFVPKEEAVIQETLKGKKAPGIQSAVKPAAAEVREAPVETVLEKQTVSIDSEKSLPSDLYTFVYLPQNKGWIGKYPVTNVQYQRFLEAPDFARQEFWMNFPKYGAPPDYVLQGDWGSEGWEWLQDALEKKERSPDSKRIEPRYWRDTNFGIQRPGVPVVGITWYEANAYCKWLRAHWVEVREGEDNKGLSPKELRPPTEWEWVAAAGGAHPESRFPWDRGEQVTKKIEDIVRCANVKESGIDRTTPVGMYPMGQSPAGVWDLAGNVWEWQANYYNKDKVIMALRGGAWSGDSGYARLSDRSDSLPNYNWRYYGFRAFLLPQLIT